MRGYFAFALVALALLFAATHYDPNAGNRILIDTPDGPLVHDSGGIKLCEKRQLVGKQHTLNPHAPPDKRIQEQVRVCVEAFPGGRPPPPPIKVTTERKPWSIA